MDRATWIATFIKALQKLRPHLAPSYGTSKLLEAIAAQEYAAGRSVEPEVAAQCYHDRVGPS